MAISVKVTRNTPQLDRYIKGLKEVDPITQKAAIKLQGDLLTAYARGGNLSSRDTNKRLTSDYREKKRESGRRGIRDLNVTGDLIRSFRVVKEAFASYSTGPRGTKNQAKMAGNLKYDENLMKVSRKNKQVITDFIKKLLLGG